jgi:hypothetical protein
MQRVAWQRAGEPFLPDPGSLAHWLKEHDLGIGRRRSGQPLAYRVAHPPWRVWPEVRVELAVDFAALYGEAWRVLGDSAPYSTILAEGSPVEVFGAMSLDALEAGG